MFTEVMSCVSRSTVQDRWRESAGRIPREETALRVAELIGHAMTHCQLQEDAHQRDALLATVMEVYRQMG